MTEKIKELEEKINDIIDFIVSREEVHNSPSFIENGHRRVNKLFKKLKDTLNKNDNEE